MLPTSSNQGKGLVSPGSKTKWLGILIATLVAVLAYLSVAEAEPSMPRLIVVGDSLSAGPESWPSQLRRLAPRWNIHLMAQNGRTIRDFSLPRDLWTDGKTNETVVYFLGGNDIIQQYDVAHAEYRMKTHINFLLERNFKVLLIVPPTFGFENEIQRQSNEAHRALISSYRQTHPNICIYDMDNVWDGYQTIDGVHPKPGLSYEMALVINMVLGMNIY